MINCECISWLAKDRCRHYRAYECCIEEDLIGFQNKPNKMKIYVASSWRNQYQQEVVETLRRSGHEVYDFKNPPLGRGGFAWSEIDPNWENWSTKEYKQALEHPIADSGFHSDFDGMKWADMCIMVLPCGRSANTEAGWMKGAGKLVYVFSPIEQEPELMYKLYDGIICTWQELATIGDTEQSDLESVASVERITETWMNLIGEIKEMKEEEIDTFVEDISSRYSISSAASSR